MATLQRAIRELREIASESDYNINGNLLVFTLETSFPENANSLDNDDYQHDVMQDVRERASGEFLYKLCNWLDQTIPFSDRWNKMFNQLRTYRGKPYPVEFHASTFIEFGERQ